MLDKKNETLVYELIMQNKNNPLSPHLQIYKWQISSLLSITNRIVGVVNVLAFVLICMWVISLHFGKENYQSINFFLNSFFGKFLSVSLCWTFSFQLLNEVRHLVWDAGFGFDLKTSKISGAGVLLGSFILTVIFYMVGKNYY